MRTPTLVVLSILLVGFGLLTWLASSSIDLMKQDIETAQRLSRLFAEREELAPETHVKLRKVAGEDGRLGPGLLVEITPSASVLAKSGSLARLVARVASEAAEDYPREGSGALQWFRVTVHLPLGVDRVVSLERSSPATLSAPVPPLPLTWPEAPAPPPPVEPPLPPAPPAPPVEAPGGSGDTPPR